MASVTIKHTKRMGRAFVSTKRIAKGTVLLECQATGNSVVLLDHLVGERCDVCLADTATKPCGNKSCAAVICATCKQSTQHASVCGAASREPVLVRSLLRLAAAERADRAVAKQLDALENHHDAYGPERRDAFKAAAARAASYCGGDARRLARHAAAFESNEFGVSEANRWRHAPLELGEESVGCGLFAAAAPANHSCAPNCDPVVVIEAGRPPVLRLVARAAIAPGQQVFIAYVPLYAPGEERRASLRDTYLFDCACARCRAERRDGTPSAAVQRAMTGRLCACGGLLRRPACLRCGRRGRPTRAHAAAAAGFTLPFDAGPVDSATSSAVQKPCTRRAGDRASRNSFVSAPKFASATVAVAASRGTASGSLTCASRRRSTARARISGRASRCFTNSSLLSSRGRSAQSHRRRVSRVAGGAAPAEQLPQQRPHERRRAARVDVALLGAAQPAVAAIAL